MPRRRLGFAAAAVALLVAGGLAAASVVSVADPDAAGIVELPEPIDRDLGDIYARDTLVVLTSYTSTSYFLYRGEPMGFEFELLREFAGDQDITFVIEVVPRDSLLYYLNAGRGDIGAARLVPVEQDTAAFAFTEPLYTTNAVVVQRDTRSPDSARVGNEPLALKARRVRRPADLAGEQVHVPDADPYATRLVELETQIPGEIEVVEVDSTTESLIRSVATGDIELTLAQENVAALEEETYGNLSVRPVVGAPHGVAWAVRRNAPLLREALDEWIAAERDTERWAVLYRKYYVDRRAYRERVETGYLTADTGVLSAYDALLKAHAPGIGWDWRLLASQMYQESRFEPDARSWAGAQGLLQIMPATARELGIANVWDPEQNVAGAVRYLEWLDRHFWRETIPDPVERTKFILASYNAGAGHVMDAQRLAEAEGGDPTRWADVAYWLLQKSRSEVYRRPEVRHGYCRGLEPVTYVSRILERYAHYRQFVSGVEGAAAVPSVETTEI